MTIAIWKEGPTEGYWFRNTSHFPTGISLHLWELFLPAHDAGTRRGFRRYGAAMDGCDFARFTGRIYVRVCPVEDPEELAERAKIAERALAVKLWRQDRAEWRIIKKSFRTRLMEFARQDPAGLSPDGLIHRLIGLRQIFVEGVIQHFAQQPASMFAVGDWLRNTFDWTGVRASEALWALRNSASSSGESADYSRAVARVAEALHADPNGSAIFHDEERAAVDRLEEIHVAAPGVCNALEAFLYEYGDRLITGFDLTDLTLRELPHLVVAALSQREKVGTLSADAGRRCSDMGDEIRLRLPADKRDAYEEGLREAQCAYGLNDEDVRTTYLWPLGLIRRSMLAAADHLVKSGKLEAPDDVFHTTPAELDALLCGAVHPGPDELARRAAEWRAWAADDPPAAFGEPQLPALGALLSPECARVTSAIRFYREEVDARSERPREGSWSVLVEGLAASPGRYEGQARVVRGPWDFERVSQGDVLIARTTSPAFNVILPILGGVVTDRGGALCHAAIVAREFGIPAVVGTNSATTKIPDGAHVLVDGDHGFVTVRR